MEYALRVRVRTLITGVRWRLNPYSNGICSTRWCVKLTVLSNLRSLNPYSNGICAMRLWTRQFSFSISFVLILILMEYAQWVCWRKNQEWSQTCLNPYSNGICAMSPQFKVYAYETRKVLILILMEYAQWDRFEKSHNIAIFES